MFDQKLVQEQGLNNERTTFELKQYGDNPFFDADNKGKLMLIKQLMLEMDQEQIEEITNKAKALTETTFLPYTKTYDDVAQQDLSFMEKAKDFGRSIKEIYRTSAFSRREGEKKERRGKLGRSMAITKMYFGDLAESKLTKGGLFETLFDEDYTAYGSETPSFLKKAWLGAKSLFGAEIKKEATNFRYNDNIMLVQTSLTQKKVQGKRKFIVEAAKTPVTLTFYNSDSWFKEPKLSLTVTNCDFKWQYDIADNKVDELWLKLNNEDINFEYGAFKFTVEKPTVEIEKDNVILAAKKSTLGIGDVSGGSLTGTAEGLKLSREGLNWTKATAECDNIKVADIVTLSFLFEMYKPDANKKPIYNSALGINFKYKGDDVNKTLKMEEVTISYENDDQNPEVEKLSLDVKNLALDLKSGMMGMDVTVNQLHISTKEKLIKANNSNFSLNIKDVNVSGHIEEISWSANEGMNFSKAIATLEKDVEIGGVTLAGGKTQLEIEKNKNNLKTITVKTGAKRRIGDFYAELEGKFQAKEVAPEQYEYSIDGIVEKAGASGKVGFKGKYFALALEGTDITYSDTIQPGQDNNNKGQEERLRKFTSGELKGQVSLFDDDISLSSTVTGLKFDGKTIAYDSLTLEGKNLDFGCLKVSSLKIAEIEEPVTDAAGKTEKIQTIYKIEELTAGLELGEISSNVKFIGRAEFEEPVSPMDGEETKAQANIKLIKLEAGESENKVFGFGFAMKIDHMEIEPKLKKGKVKMAEASMSLPFGEKRKNNGEIEGSEASGVKVDIAGTMYNIEWTEEQKKFERMKGELKTELNLLDLKVDGKAEVEVFNTEKQLREVIITSDVKIQAGNFLSGELKNAKIEASEIRRAEPTKPGLWNYKLQGLKDNEGVGGKLKLKGKHFALNLDGTDMTYSDTIKAGHEDREIGKEERERKFTAKELKGQVIVFDNVELNSTVTGLEFAGNKVTYKSLTLEAKNAIDLGCLKVSAFKISEKEEQITDAAGKTEKIQTFYAIEELTAGLKLGEVSSAVKFIGRAEFEEPVSPVDGEETNAQAEIKLLKLEAGESANQAFGFGFGIKIENMEIEPKLKKGKIKKAQASLSLPFGEKRNSNDKVEESEAGGVKVDITGTVYDVEWEKDKKKFRQMDGTLQSDLNLFGIKISGGTKALVKYHNEKQSLKLIEITQNINITDDKYFSGNISNAKLVATEIQPQLWNYRLEGVDEINKMKAAAKLKTSGMELAVDLENINYQDNLNEDELKKGKQVRERSFKAGRATTSISILGITKAAGSFTDLHYDGADWSFKELKFSLKDGKIGSYFSIKTGDFTLITLNNEQNKGGEEKSGKEEKKQQKKQYNYQVNIEDATINLGIAKYKVGMKGSAQQLTAQEAEESGIPALPQGWLFKFDKVETAIEKGDDEKEGILAGFGLNLQMTELLINTQQNSGKLANAGFEGSLFQKKFTGNVTGLTWDAAKYNLGQWTATVPELQLGNLLSIGSTTYMMTQKGNQISRRLESKKVNIDFPPNNPFFSGEATDISYDLEKELFTAEKTKVAFKMGNNTLTVGLNKVTINKARDVDAQKVDSSFTSSGPLKFLNNLFELSELTFTLDKSKGSTAIEIGGSAAIGGPIAKVFNIEAKKATVAKKLSEDDFSGNIGELTLGVASLAVSAKNISFTNQSFACVFPKLTTESNVAGLSGLLNPVDWGICKLKKFFSNSLELPRQLSYENGQLMLTKAPEDSENAEKIDLATKNISCLTGELNLANLKASNVNFDLKFPSLPKKYDPSSKESALDTSFKFMNASMPVFSIGFADLSVGLEGGFGFKFAGPLKPSLIDEKEGEPKIQLKGGVILNSCAFAEVNAGINLGVKLLGSVGAAAYARGGGPLAPTTNEATITLQKDDEDYKLVGTESSLEVKFDTPIKASLGAKLKVTFLGKDKTLKDLVFAEKRFGNLKGTYRYNFAKGNDQKAKLTTIEELHFIWAEDLETSLANYQKSEQNYEELLEKADSLFLPQEKGQEIPRKELVRRGMKVKEEVDRELKNNRDAAYNIQVELAEHTAKSNIELKDARKHIKKHEYRIKNEESFQKGLKEWDINKDIVPTYKWYNTKASAIDKLQTRISSVQTIMGSISDIKGDYKQKNYKNLFKHIKAINKEMEVFFTEEPPKKNIKPGKEADELEFYETLLAQIGWGASPAKDIYKSIKEAGSVTQASQSELSDKVKGDSEEKRVRWLAFQRIFQTKRNSLAELPSFKKNSRDAHGWYMDQIVDKLAKLDNNLLEHQSTADGGESTTAGNLDFMLFGGTLKKLYSDKAVKEAENKAKAEVEEILKTLKTPREQWGTGVDIRNLAGHISYSKDTQKLAIQSLVHKYVRKHTHGRIDNYNKKFKETAAKTEQYQNLIADHNKRTVELGKRAKRLRTLMFENEKLMRGDGSTIQELVNSDKQIQVEKSVVSNLNNIVAAPDSIVSNEKARIDAIVTSLNADADKHEQEEAEAEKASG